MRLRLRFADGAAVIPPIPSILIHVTAGCRLLPTKEQEIRRKEILARPGGPPRISSRASSRVVAPEPRPGGVRTMADGRNPRPRLARPMGRRSSPATRSPGPRPWVRPGRQHPSSPAPLGGLGLDLPKQVGEFARPVGPPPRPAPARPGPACTAHFGHTAGPVIDRWGILRAVRSSRADPLRGEGSGRRGG